MMVIVANTGQFPGAPDGSLLGKWEVPGMEGGAAWSLAAMGDLSLSGAIGRAVQRMGGGGQLFEEIRPALAEADCVAANLESPLLDNWSADKMFAGDARRVDDLAAAGFDMLHLASNHMLDFGAEGFARTIEVVRGAGIEALGVGPSSEAAARMVVNEHDGLRVGWLGAGHTLLKQPRAPRLWELDVEEMLAAVRRARPQVDLLIVSLHWGPMLVDYPYLEQYEAAHRLAEAGASAVLMHHAHLLQGVEVHEGVPVCYNLGNLIFDPGEGLKQKARSFTHVKYEEQLTTCVFRLEFCDGRFRRLLAAPVVLPDPARRDPEDFALRWAPPDVAKRILDRLGRISDDLAGDFSEKLNRQLWANRSREIRINLDLIIRHREFWRLGYLAGRILHGRRLLWLVQRALGLLRNVFRRKGGREQSA